MAARHPSNRACYWFLITCLYSTLATAQMPQLTPLPGTGQLATSDNPTKFSFIAAGDNRPARKSCPQPLTPRQIFSAVPKTAPHPAFVLWTGDTISGKQPEKPKRIRKQYEEFLEIARTAGVPVFNAPGNHEMDDGDNIPSKEMKAMYEKYMGPVYGAFTYGNSRFIALNSENEPPSGASSKGAKKKGKPEAPGYITRKQLGFLEQDLDAHKDAAHVFVFMHHPVKPAKKEDGLAPESVAALQKLFQRYDNVSYVISGHEHMYYNGQATTPDQIIPPPKRSDPSQPPYYLVSGGAGAPLKNLPGGFHHYLVFNVDGPAVVPTLVKLESASKDDSCDTQ